ncbi:hypothetical protein J3B02_006393, partial [Coemansia erecta]
DILPEIPPDTRAFAYRPYVTASAAAVDGKSLYTQHQSLLRDIKPQTGKRIDDGTSGFQRKGSPSSSSVSSNGADSCGSCQSNGRPLNARIVGRKDDVQSDRHRMAAMHAKSMYARIKEAKRLIDDCRYEYACDVLYECQRG